MTFAGTLCSQRSAGAYWLATDHNIRPATKFENPFGIMPTLAPHLAGLPVEILDQIFPHPPAQDIIKMDTVRRLVTSSTRFCIDFFVT